MTASNDSESNGTGPQHIVVVGPDGAQLGSARVPSADEAEPAGQDVSGLVEQPAKVMRIGTMIKQLLEEVRAAPLDDASRNRLREIHKA
ncbi:MAG TPA: proteasome activator, partial [Kutzneria sp.]